MVSAMNRLALTPALSDATGSSSHSSSASSGHSATASHSKAAPWVHRDCIIATGCATMIWGTEQDVFVNATPLACDEQKVK
jgi:hypothetical protein